MPPNGKPASIAPSLARIKRGVGTESTNGLGNEANGTHNATTAGNTNPPYPYDTQSEPNNPTVVPRELLEKFHFTFLIRHPRSSIPSYYRCTIPPLDEITGFYNFMPSEAGYDELRRVFDYLRSIGQVGPKIAGQNSNIETLPAGSVEICVIDADDLLDNPYGIIEAYCKTVGLDYSPDMLSWDSEEDHQRARDAFEKWKGFHEDAINSTSLKPRQHVSPQSPSLLRMLVVFFAWSLYNHIRSTKPDCDSDSGNEVHVQC